MSWIVFEVFIGLTLLRSIHHRGGAEATAMHSTSCGHTPSQLYFQPNGHKKIADRSRMDLAAARLIKYWSGWGQCPCSATPTMWEEFVHNVCQSHKLRSDHINNWGNWGVLVSRGAEKPCPWFCQKKLKEENKLWSTVDHRSPHLSGLQQCLADMISCHTTAHQECFKLISSRRICLPQCFNEYGSSCFSKHHLSAVQGQTEPELSEQTAFHCVFYTVVSVRTLESSAVNIFHFHSQSQANKKKYLNARQDGNNLSPGTKASWSEGIGKKKFSAVMEGKFCEGRFDFCRSKYNFFLPTFGVVERQNRWLTALKQEQLFCLQCFTHASENESQHNALTELCVNMSNDSLSSILHNPSVGGQQVYSRLCACAAGMMCPFHTCTYPHTASVISFSEMLTLSLLFAPCSSPYSLRLGDAHAEQSECAHTLVCLGSARCWEDPLQQRNREVTVQGPFNWSVLSGAKQTAWHLDPVHSQHIKGGKMSWIFFFFFFLSWT